MKSAADWMSILPDASNDRSRSLVNANDICTIQRDALLEAIKLVREKHSITGAADAILERSREI